MGIKTMIPPDLQQRVTEWCLLCSPEELRKPTIFDFWVVLNSGLTFPKHLVVTNNVPHFTLKGKNFSLEKENELFIEELFSVNDYDSLIKENKIGRLIMGYIASLASKASEQLPHLFSLKNYSPVFYSKYNFGLTKILSCKQYDVTTITDPVIGFPVDLFVGINDKGLVKIKIGLNIIYVDKPIK